MMEGLLPRPLRLLGLGFSPGSLCTTELLTPEELARVGLRPMVGHRLIKAFLRAVLKVSQRTEEHTPLAASLAHVLLQGMVDADRRGEVSFAIPLNRFQLRLHHPSNDRQTSADGSAGRRNMLKMVDVTRPPND